MARIDARDAPIDVLRADDLEQALALSAEAGWNQDAADWGLMLRLGQGFAVRDSGRVVATAIALPYPPVFGWVSMVLVHGPYRRRGLATRLVERATAALADAGLVPVLDATPAGAVVYRGMGFRPVANLMRWRGAGGGRGAAPVAPRLADGARELDCEAFGADRGAVLDDLAERPAPVSLGAPEGGYLLSRAGRTATQLGPLVARDAATAVALLGAGLDAIGGHGRGRSGGARDRCGAAPLRARLCARAALRAHGARQRRDRRRARARPRHRRPGARLMRWQEIPAGALAAFRDGAVIPAHPLALDADRRLDERRQRALTRYYVDAGAGGLAVGVHTTQFAIREVGLYRPVLELAVDTASAWTERPLFLVAGVAGRTERGGRRGADRARPRLPRRARQPGRLPRRLRGRHARALPGARR